jgi:hypothetical protein
VETIDAAQAKGQSREDAGSAAGNRPTPVAHERTAWMGHHVHGCATEHDQHSGFRQRCDAPFRRYPQLCGPVPDRR